MENSSKTPTQTEPNTTEGVLSKINRADKEHDFITDAIFPLFPKELQDAVALANQAEESNQQAKAEFLRTLIANAIKAQGAGLVLGVGSGLAAGVFVGEQLTSLMNETMVGGLHPLESVLNVAISGAFGTVAAAWPSAVLGRAMGKRVVNEGLTRLERIVNITAQKST